jgi:hypothetical protein
MMRLICEGTDQLLVEAMVLSLAGGVLGMVAGAGSSKRISAQVGGVSWARQARSSAALRDHRLYRTL